MSVKHGRRGEFVAQHTGWGWEKGEVGVKGEVEWWQWWRSQSAAPLQIQPLRPSLISPHYKTCLGQRIGLVAYPKNLELVGMLSMFDFSVLFNICYNISIWLLFLTLHVSLWTKSGSWEEVESIWADSGNLEYFLACIGKRKAMDIPSSQIFMARS